MSKSILVVEDQEDNRQIIRDLLSATDYEITEAESGEQALEAVAKQRPDLILMDIQLPGIDGYEVTRRIKANPALRSIPIIAVTSYALAETLQSAPTTDENSAVLAPVGWRHRMRFEMSSDGSALTPRAQIRDHELLRVRAAESGPELPRQSSAFASVMKALVATVKRLWACISLP